VATRCHDLSTTPTRRQRLIHDDSTSSRRQESSAIWRSTRCGHSTRSYASCVRSGPPSRGPSGSMRRPIDSKINVRVGWGLVRHLARRLGQRSSGTRGRPLSGWRQLIVSVFFVFANLYTRNHLIFGSAHPVFLLSTCLYVCCEFVHSFSKNPFSNYLLLGVLITFFCSFSGQIFLTDACCLYSSPAQRWLTSGCATVLPLP
jgi:hypothetical protein